MKVVHIITGLNDGGAEGVLFRLCLNSTNNRHIVISLMDKGKYGPLLEDAGVSVYYLGMNPGRPSIKRFLKLVSLIRSEEPDAVQTWMYHADLFGGIAGRLVGVKNICWGIRNSNPRINSKSTFIVSKLCALLSSLIPKKIICCGHEAAKVHADIGYEIKKIEVIQNGYDFNEFSTNSEARKLKREVLGATENCFLIGIVARYNIQKDHDNFLRSFSILADQGLDVKAVLVGYGIDDSNAMLTSRIKELGIHDKVLLLGAQRNIPALMNAFDIHVISSVSEGFPNVVAEAMAVGTPCVVTDVGDAAEIVGDTGWVVPSRSSEKLSSAMMFAYDEWLNYSDKWLKRKESSKIKSHNDYSLETMVVKYHCAWEGRA